MALSRTGAWLIAAALLLELALLPWSAHAFDATAFMLHADRVFFGHIPPVKWWPFGSIALASLLLSQIPVLFVPAFANAIPLRIFLLKLPAWCADVASAAAIRWACPDPRFANFWALRYLLDPAVIFVTVFHGQFDALPNACVVIGIALLANEKYELAALALGLGAGTKFYPAAFVPLLVVVAFRRGSAVKALVSLGIFALVTACTLLPVMWGRFGSVANAYAENSFGAHGAATATISSASLWALFPPGIAPQAEQLIAVAVPVLLALFELRHRSSRTDVARVAMLSALSIVALNPGAHPPFYLWVAGPLVLYAALSDDGLVSLAGAALSCLSVMMQFCQEGSDEYFLLNFGPAPPPGMMQCIVPPFVLDLLALACVAVIVFGSYRKRRANRFETPLRWAGGGLAAAFFVAFCVSMVWVVALQAPHGRSSYLQEKRSTGTFTVGPLVERAGGRCLLTYAPYDFLVFAGNPYASQFVRAYLGYTLFSPESMTIRQSTVDMQQLPNVYEDKDILTVTGHAVRVTREFDITKLLMPYRPSERLVESPCSAIVDNPLLIYRFDVEAARQAAAQKPLLERLNVFSQTL